MSAQKGRTHDERLEPGYLTRPPEALVAGSLATANHPNYGGALAIFSCGTFLAVIFFSAIGREAKETDFAKAAELPAGRDREHVQYPAGLPQA